MYCCITFCFVTYSHPKPFVYDSSSFAMQVEHHLCPTMTQSCYPLIQKDVKELCQAHGIEYLEQSFFQAVYENHMQLHEIAKSARREYWGWK